MAVSMSVVVAVINGTLFLFFVQVMALASVLNVKIGNGVTFVLRAGTMEVMLAVLLSARRVNTNILSSAVSSTHFGSGAAAAIAVIINRLASTHSCVLMAVVVAKASL